MGPCTHFVNVQTGLGGRYYSVTMRCSVKQVNEIIRASTMTCVPGENSGQPRHLTCLPLETRIPLLPNQCTANILI